MGNENLPRRVGQMLFGTNHVRDFEVIIVDNGCQVVQARSVGTLDNMILFPRPIEHNFATDQIIKNQTVVARHLESHDRLTAVAFKTPSIQALSTSPFIHSMTGC